MGEVVYTPPGVGETGNQPIPSIESRMLDTVKSIQKHEGKELRLPDVRGVYDQLVGLESELAGNIPEENIKTIKNVRLGFGFLAYNQFSDSKKGAFLMELRRQRKNENTDHVELTSEQAQILHKVAAAINIPYNQEDTFFPFAEVENKVPSSIRLYNP